jgi:hypothetical protein
VPPETHHNLATPFCAPIVTAASAFLLKQPYSSEAMRRLFAGGVVKPARQSSNEQWNGSERVANADERGGTLRWMLVCLWMRIVGAKLSLEVRAAVTKRLETKPLAFS